MVESNKVMEMLKSRKFWVSLIGVIGSVFALELSDAQIAEVAQGFVVVAGSIGYVVSLALTDAASIRANSE